MMKRRNFIQYSATGAGLFIVSLNALKADKAYAFGFLLGNPILGLVFRGLLRNAFAFAQTRNKRWWENRLDVQLAQREFVAQQFTNVTVAEVTTPQESSIVVGAERYEKLGYNASLSLPQVRGSKNSMAYFAGPAPLGMSLAAEYLYKHERMSYEEVQSAILPMYQEYADWNSWSESTANIAYTNSASDTGVLIKYESVKPHQGGYGIIDVTVNANKRIKIPSIQVNYAGR